MKQTQAPTTSYKSNIMLSDNLDRLNRKQIEHLAESNFRQMLTVAKEQLLRTYPMLDMITNSAELSQVPILDGDELAKGCPPYSNRYQFKTEDGGLVLRSSGTSGKFKMMYHSWAFNRQVRWIGARGMEAAFLNEIKLVANVLVPAALNGSSNFAHELCELLQARSYLLGNQMPMEQVLDIINACQIDTCIGSPKMIMDMLSNASNISSLRNIAYIGAAFEAHDIEKLESRNINVRSLAYSTSETGPVGYQCPHCQHNEYHIHEDAMIVEIVCPDTECEKHSEEIGEVLLTPLSDSGMALFRYRIGDMASWVFSPCRCGSQTRKIKLLGRSDSSMIVDVINLHEAQFLAALRPLGVDQVGQFQFGVEWQENRKFKAILRIENTATTSTTDEIFQAVKAHYEINTVVNHKRCRSFEIEKCERKDFRHNQREKMLSMYQIKSRESL